MSMEEDHGGDPGIAAPDLHFWVNWYENASLIARALGVDVDLPDVGNRDPGYWASFDRQAWRDAAKGRVEMAPEDIDRYDPDWLLLKTLWPGAEAWFDLEEGVKFKCPAGDLTRLVSLIRQLAALDGLRLSAEWPGTVTAMRSIAGWGTPTEEELRPYLTAAGFRPDGPLWLLVP